MRYISISQWPVRSLLFVLAGIAATGQVNITTWQADLRHTGANLNETTLTPQNVGSPGDFGLLFTQAMDGQSYGQPLYVGSPALGKFADGSNHNAVYVATEHCSVYAFDADAPGGGPLWHASLLPPGTIPVPQSDVGSGDIQVELGITTTPVIDTSTGTLYIVSKVKVQADSTYRQYLYALDLKTGAPKLGSPVLINPTFAGSASEGTGGVIPFSALHEHLRGAMALYNGVIYLSYASHSDTQPYHGEILGYDAQTLALVRTFITTPNGSEGGFWAAGAGPAFDSQGNMFVPVANGAFDQTPSPFTTGTDWGESVLKLPTNATGPIQLSASNTLNWFTPNNWAFLNHGDLDLGSGGLTLLPDQAGGNHPHIMVGGGKGAVLYVLDRDNLGGINTPDNAVQEIPEMGGRWLFVTPAYFNGNIYYSASGGPLEQRAVGFDPTTGNYISPTPIMSGKAYNGKGSGVFISASGNNNGIVWILNGNGVDAYNAANVSGNPIYTGRSTVPSGNIGTQNTKFSLPMVANGKVYYTAFNTATNVGYLFASGLLSAPAGGPAAPTSLQASGTGSGSTVLTWTDNSNNESGFNINRASSASGPFNQVGSVGANITKFADTGLSPQTTYFYQVVAANAGGASAPSNVAAATTFPIFAQAGLVAYWNLDGLGPNNSVADATNDGHNGTANGEAVFTQGGFINGAFTFHGTNVASNISVPNSPALQFAANQSFTLSAWVNPANVSGIEQPIIAKSADQGNQYGIFINSSNHWVFRGPLGDLAGPTAVQGSWTHVAAVQDGVAGTRSLYVNGALAASGAAQAADGGGQFVIGQATAAGGSLGFEGIVDEVRLYNVALPPSGVTALLGPPILEAVSNQNHGAAGTFGLTLFPSSTPVIEPRKGAVSGLYSVAVHFAAPVSPGLTASLTLKNGAAAVGSVSSVVSDPSGTVVTVVLTGVANLQSLNLHLSAIQPGNGTADIPLNILWGDVNRDGVVNNLDLTTVQSSFTQALNQINAFYDVNVDGIVNSTDAALVSAEIGTTLGIQVDTNLALFQPASASSVTQPNVETHAFDNDPNTRWESVQGPTADPSWLEVNLGSPAAIHQIVINWENAAGANYQIQVSNDNATWTPIVNVTGNTSGGIKTYSNLNAVGQYVRMYGTTRTTIYGYSIWEFQVLGIPVSNSGGGASPSITSPLTATGTVGTAFSYQIAATQNPTSYSATGLPAGLSVNSVTGAITGTPTTAGASTVTITAKNASGSGSGNLMITINPAPTAPPAPASLAANPGSGQVSLSWSASAGATSYSVFRGTASGAEGSSPVAQGLTGTTYTDSAVTAGTKYFYFVKAVNTVGASIPSVEASATPTGVTAGTGVAIYQIDAGSTVDVAPFTADKFFTNGAAKSVTTTVATAGIANAAPMQIYQSYRYGGGGFTYTIPGLTANGNYTVRLHFAETNFTAAGKRLFNVAINGATVLSNFDIFAAGGGANIAVVKDFPATANASGTIVIVFSGGAADLPKVNGIEIITR